MLLPWIAGRRSRRHITLAHARMLGRIAATLHTQARTRALPPSGAIKLWGRERISGAVLAGSEIGQVLPSVSGVIQAIDTAVFDALNSISSTEFGLINAHLGVHNVLWHASGPGLVDFNDSGIGPYAFCFARLRAQLARRENGQALTLGLVKGYQEICALPEGVTMQPGIFDIAADLFLARYTAAKLSRAGAFNKRVAVQLFGEFRSRLAALSGHATM
jgi:Ser/Thr protein kinase RdoA (MazF antagonist)